jgi:hypothetical protein
MEVQSIKKSMREHKVRVGMNRIKGKGRTKEGMSVIQKMKLTLN